jgi:alkanesulfonate monooxygenase SsuD/methylene tetrahydromethanopterin reductase-like flavin-dependent oxidoreductase (luciferase family)
MPDFPEQGPADARGRATAFRDQVLTFLDVIQGQFDTAWAGDHFFPWPADMDQSLETFEAWTLITYLMATYRMSFVQAF